VQKLNETAAPRCDARPTTVPGNVLLIPQEPTGGGKNQSNPQPGFPDEFLVFSLRDGKKTGKDWATKRASRALVSA